MDRECAFGGGGFRGFGGDGGGGGGECGGAEGRRLEFNELDHCFVTCGIDEFWDGGEGEGGEVVVGAGRAGSPRSLGSPGCPDSPTCAGCAGSRMVMLPHRHYPSNHIHAPLIREGQHAEFVQRFTSRRGGGNDRRGCARMRDRSRGGS